jgi:hypothetical protein
MKNRHFKQFSKSKRSNPKPDLKSNIHQKIISGAPRSQSIFQIKNMHMIISIEILMFL